MIETRSPSRKMRWAISFSLLGKPIKKKLCTIDDPGHRIVDFMRHTRRQLPQGGKGHRLQGKLLQPPVLHGEKSWRQERPFAQAQKPLPSEGAAIKILDGQLQPALRAGVAGDDAAGDLCKRRMRIDLLQRLIDLFRLRKNGRTGTQQFRLKMLSEKVGDRPAEKFAGNGISPDCYPVVIEEHDSLLRSGE